MKFCFILYILFLSTSLSFTQGAKGTVSLSDSSVRADNKLSRFIIVINKDWNVKYKDSCMTISLKDSVWVSYFNAANRSVNDTTERLFDDSTFIKQNGKKILPEMTFY